ncbi:MFS transporter [Aliidiomarina minuta]|uniref:MFS transporter n=1 Tax=Aliidiomarina minuta TaxID=880057 RepID=A0A432W9F0_9GAMM|nr:MFS transporter [Aliidiomarina minuta]RUO26218.1 MFS transporter [Aliidiomarina minuta]
MNTPKLRTWRDTLAFYTQRRLLIIFLLGMASGYPWIMIGSSMSAWLNELGFTRATIGYFGAVFAAYSVNFLWSPLIDRVKLPLLTRWLGQRRGWVIFCQVGIAASCFYLSTLNFHDNLAWAGMVALCIAVFSATQDIGIDAFRIDTIGLHEARVQSAAAAMTTAGWWTGFGALGAIPFFLADLPAWDWNDIYKIMALGMLVLTIGTWLASEPRTARVELQREAELKYQKIAFDNPALTLLMTIMAGVFIASVVLALNFIPGDQIGVIIGWSIFQVALLAAFVSLLVKLQKREFAPAAEDHQGQSIKRSHRIIAWIIVTTIEPISEFFQRNGVRMALTVLLFVLLFKVGEAFLGRMSIVFYQEIGFSNTEIGLYSKLMNWWVTIAFALIGSYVNMRLGIIKGLLIGGSAMAVSNLLFSALAIIGPDKVLFVTAVVSDGFTSAWSTVAFVAFISLLCNRAFTATQYALMASLGTLGRTVLATYSGAVVDFLDGNWALFFMLTTLMVIPSLFLLWTIRHKIRALETENKERQDAHDRSEAN